MADLFDSTDQKDILLPPKTLRVGETVQITIGPMTNFVAQVEELSKSDRVVVLLNMMGQAVRTEMPRKHVLSLTDLLLFSNLIVKNQWLKEKCSGKTSFRLNVVLFTSDVLF